MKEKELTSKIKNKALELGFAKVGITIADDFSEYAEELEKRSPVYDRWISRPLGPYKGAHPRSFMPEAKSIVCVIDDYSGIAYPQKLTKSVGRIYLSRLYMAVPDSLNGVRLASFRDFLRENGCKVDDSGTSLPLRAACSRAGIITYGCNNFAYAEGYGSFIVLNAFLIDTELEYDAPTIERSCPPSCHKCIDACPTGALISSGRLLPQNCLLFRHIGSEPIPEEIREANGIRIHGCDACQEVCPRNKKPIADARRHDPFLEVLAEEFDLEKVLLLDIDYYQRVIQPIMYHYIHDLSLFQRNAAIAIGNSGNTSYIPALEKALKICEASVRVYVVWALEKLIQH